MTWTVNDELNLQAWVDKMGFKIVYLTKEHVWGYAHNDKPNEINGGFPNLSDLKQHFVNLKGENKNVRVVSQIEFQQEMEKARKLQKLH